MEKKWTEEQCLAITAQDCNLLVAAAAGAGKTAVLVERIIRKITGKHPVDIDRLLIVTFTNAAAAEMRERIAAAITGILENNYGNKGIRRQLTLLSKASITTIHSFCLKVIRSNFQEADLDPGLRVADETEAYLLKIEALNELFEDQYEMEDENTAFLQLLDSYGGTRDDLPLQDIVLNLYDFIQSCPWPEKWLEEKTGMLNSFGRTDFSETPWGQIILQTIAVELEGFIERMDGAAGMLTPDCGLDEYRDIFGEDLIHLKYLQAICRDTGQGSWDKLFLALEDLEFKRLPSAGKKANMEIRDAVKKTRDRVKKQLAELSGRLIPACSAEIYRDLDLLRPGMERLSGLVQEFSARYAQKKSRRSILDFNDLEHYCLEILTERNEAGEIGPSKVALGYRENFAEILVDEYQDSNEVQETIFQMISREGLDRPNVFMVGDVKQSIYRFRQAKPELFQSKYENYPEDEGNAYRKIVLKKNFRSRGEVLAGVNFLFHRIMSEQLGELDYSEKEFLNPGAEYPENTSDQNEVGGKIEFYLLAAGESSEEPEQNQEGEEDQDEGTIEAEIGEKPAGELLTDPGKHDAVQAEARLVGHKIKQLMKKDGQGGIFQVLEQNGKGTGKVYRDIAYKDIVILLRTTKNWADIFAEELNLLGIPAYTDSGENFFKNFEVQVMLSLLQIIDNPYQDIPLLAVLRSAVGGFTTDELAQLRLADRGKSLYEALAVLARAGRNSETAEKAARFINNLKSWRQSSVYLSTDRLLWQLYQETGYYNAVGAMPGGEQRQANLTILFERAREYEATSYKGLFNFINFADKLKNSSRDLGSAKMLGENDNVVRIMSIHKSKGLEFPVVILAGCGKKFNLQDMNKNTLFHHHLGFGPDVVHPKLRLSYPSLPKLAVREKLRVETLSEEMRILYVALTRAREKLIVTGSVGNLAKALEKWRSCPEKNNKLALYEVRKASRYLDWIGPALFGSFSGNQVEGRSAWHIEFRDERDLFEVQAEPQEKAVPGDQIMQDDKDPGDYAAEVDPGIMAEVRRRLSWEYPYHKLTTLPAKISVTEIKRLYAEEQGPESGFSAEINMKIKKPLFLEGKRGLTATEAGSVMHFVMQHLDLSRGDTAIQIKKMVEKDLLSVQQAKSVDIAKITRFLSSTIGERMLSSSLVRRETPFNLELPCPDIYRELKPEDCLGQTVLLQGVIDCFFEEPDGLVLLDYKTDYVPDGGEESFKEKYRIQILYYSLALERLTGKKVKEKVLYLFWNGKTLSY